MTKFVLETGSPDMPLESFYRIESLYSSKTIAYYDTSFGFKVLAYDTDSISLTGSHQQGVVLIVSVGSLLICWR